MSHQLSLAAAASAFALVALCLHAPAIEGGRDGVESAPVAAMAGIEVPDLPLASLFSR